jgi:hypothetical protein
MVSSTIGINKSGVVVAVVVSVPVAVVDGDHVLLLLHAAFDCSKECIVSVSVSAVSVSISVAELKGPRRHFSSNRLGWWSSLSAVGLDDVAIVIICLQCRRSTNVAHIRLVGERDWHEFL